MLSKKEILLSGAAGFLIGALYVLQAVLTSTNSTAAIGFLFIPVYGAAGAAVSCLAFAMYRKSTYTRLGLGVIVLVLLYTFYSYRAGLRIAANTNSSPADLISVINKSYAWGKTDILIAVANNPAAGSEILDMLATSKEQEVLFEVAKNKKTPPATLERLTSQDETHYLLAAAASNPQISRELIRKILGMQLQDFKSELEYKIFQTHVLGHLARNPSLADEDFKKLMDWPAPEYFLIFGVVESGRATCDYLKNVVNGPHQALQQNAKSRMQKQNCSGF